MSIDPLIVYEEVSFLHLRREERWSTALGHPQKLSEPFVLMASKMAIAGSAQQGLYSSTCRLGYYVGFTDSVLLTKGKPGKACWAHEVIMEVWEEHGQVL